MCKPATVPKHAFTLCAMTARSAPTALLRIHLRSSPGGTERRRQMTINYDQLKKEFPKLKAALTRAQNTKDPQKLLAAAEKGLARFEEIGFPDQWHRWERAKDDAKFAIARGLPLL